MSDFSAEALLTEPGRSDHRSAAPPQDPAFLPAADPGSVRKATMPSLLRAIIVFALLCASSALGFVLQTWLMHPFSEQPALDFISVVTAFLVTITSIVVGLLINAAKNLVSATEDHWTIYSGQLIRLDQSLRNYGPEAEPVRRLLQGYTAAGIVNFWRTEAFPTGVSYPDVSRIPRDEGWEVLSELLNRIELMIIQLKPADPLHEKLAADCFEHCKEFEKARLSLVLEAKTSLPGPFLRVVVSWLMIIFLCFGLRAPANPLVIMMVGIAAATLSSMTFAVMDVVNPYKGLYNISSKNMRRVLNTMIRHNVAHAD